MARQRSHARRGAELPTPDALWRFFPGDAEMARRMRAFEWARSTLEPPLDPARREDAA